MRIHALEAELDWSLEKAINKNDTTF